MFFLWLSNDSLPLVLFWVSLLSNYTLHLYVFLCRVHVSEIQSCSTSNRYLVSLIVTTCFHFLFHFRSSYVGFVPRHERKKNRKLMFWLTWFLMWCHFYLYPDWRTMFFCYPLLHDVIAWFSKRIVGFMHILIFPSMSDLIALKPMVPSSCHPESNFYSGLSF